MNCNLAFKAYNINVDSLTERKDISLNVLPHFKTKAKHKKAVFMSKFIDLTGQKFGRLTVIKKVGSSKNKSVLWLCKCDCGSEIVVTSNNLRTGNSKSCGCLATDIRKKLCTKHGLKYTRIYNIWRAMKQRCYNKNAKNYKNYGARGIKICDEWLQNFKNFYDWAMKNDYAENLSIDRIDVNGNYEPKNCRWITLQEQNNNRRSNNNITFGEKTQNLTQWCKLLNIKKHKIYASMEKGHSCNDAICSLLGFTKQQLDEFFETNDYTKLLTESEVKNG